MEETYQNILLFTDIFLKSYKIKDWEEIATPEFHKEIWARLDKWEDINIVCPRWHWKTTSLFFYILHSIVFKKHKSILYIASGMLGEEMIWKLRYELETNERLIYTFGNLVPKNSDDKKDTKLKKWRQKEMELLNWVSIKTLSMWQKVRWLRPTLVVWDDVQENKDVINPVMIERFNNRMFTSVYNTLLPWWTMAILGTVVWELCFVNYLKWRNWLTIQYEACNANFENVLRPEMWNKESLMDRKKKIWDDEFNQEFRNIPMIINWKPVFDLNKVREIDIYWIDRYEDNDIAIYIDAEEWKDYYYWVDTSGWWINWDYATIVVRDSNAELMAKYRWHIEPDQLCEKIDILWKLWYRGVVWIERNNTGIGTIVEAKKYSRYYDIYSERVIDTKTNKRTKKVWWITTMKSKPLMITDLRTYIREWLLLWIDDITQSELTTFYHNDKWWTEAITWYHDDTVISEAICLQMIKQKPLIEFN